MRGIPGLHHGQDLTSSCISPVSGFIRTFRLYYRQGKIRNSVARKPLFKACILTVFFAVGSEKPAQQSLRSFQVARNLTILWDGKPRYLTDAFRRFRQTFCSQPQFFRLHWKRRLQDDLKRLLSYTTLRSVVYQKKTCVVVRLHFNNIQHIGSYEWNSIAFKSRNIKVLIIRPNTTIQF